MPSIQHPAAKASTAKRYVPQLSDSLHPLAEEVGRAIAFEVRLIGSDCHHSADDRPLSTGKKRQAAARDQGQDAAELCIRLDGLEARMVQLVVTVLERTLRSDSMDGKALRMALIMNLASAEAGSGASQSQVSDTAGPTDNALMTTAAAAALLEVSRPYVSMLCDAGKLGEIVVTEGGHRRIRSSSVQAYLSERVRQSATDLSPREAGEGAGLYDRPDSDYKKVRRGSTDKSGALKMPASRKPRP